MFNFKASELFETLKYFQWSQMWIKRTLQVFVVLRLLHPLQKIKLKKKNPGSSFLKQLFCLIVRIWDILGLDKS